MNRKLVFTGYSLIVLGLFLLVPRSFPNILPKAYAGLLFGYQERPFFLMIFSLFDVFFDYVSLTVPQAELFSIRTFFLIRRPSVSQVYGTYLRFILPYFIPFVLSKLVALLIWPQAQIGVWIVFYILVWLAWLLANLNRRVAIPNGFILVVFAGLRVLGHLWL